MNLLFAAVMLVQGVPAIENGACVSVEDADKTLSMYGEEIVGMIPTLPIGVWLLVQRADGTFKGMFYDMRVRQVCHVNDFTGDPRLGSSIL